MSADGVPSHYTSYLLRVWRVCEQDRMTCRALLENIATGERMGFSDLDGLKMFLETGGLENPEASQNAQDFAAKFQEPDIGD
ncbi:hypothetical protein [Chloroflexus aggregans]|uniref:Uncharacterized protein n=1 Tax=Chloroflexus aggregans (strain MD-66 / DSM 9485) TaxID=326427 RepID=B8G884_CHLAD|nr:hypothetical protein [Chloroflexus aggregans]ACL26138.1 hypothetical protein Cagg_3285 [Chloroflexus aggregans DSM 9485]